MNKWWLISDDDVQRIRKALAGTALHTLNSGLHETEAIPSDFAQETPITEWVESWSKYMALRWSGGMWLYGKPVTWQDVLRFELFGRCADWQTAALAEEDRAEIINAATIMEEAPPTWIEWSPPSDQEKGG